VAVRLLVATHRDLEALVRDGKFRQDLFHRVFVFPLRLPPLRERREDIPPLVEHFAAQVSATNGWKPTKFTADAIAALQQYAWPGNIRELRNAVERLMLLATSSEVTAETVALALPASSVSPEAAFAGSGPLADRVRAFEKQTILAELKRNHNQISNTARALGLERSHLYKKAEQVGIDLKTVRNERDSQ
jgi:two-component system, NtrC family, nitrogen regulation response regulator NtrX